jgi:hypothetical protein
LVKIKKQFCFNFGNSIQKLAQIFQRFYKVFSSFTKPANRTSMTINFSHKGEQISGKVILSDAVRDALIVFPDNHLAELGWSHFFQKKENEWTSETFLKEKYPDTYSNILSQLALLQHS